MRRYSKKDIKKIAERLKKMKEQLKFIEKNFYIELGRAFEKEINKESCDVESLKKIYIEIKEKYGF